MLTREQILNAVDCELTKVEVPEWGGEIYIKSLSGAESEQLKEATENSDLTDAEKMAVTLAISIVDENGHPLFTRDDMVELSKKSFRVLVRLIDKFNEVNGFTQSVEDTAKNLETIQN